MWWEEPYQTFSCLRPATPLVLRCLLCLVWRLNWRSQILHSCANQPLSVVLSSQYSLITRPVSNISSLAVQKTRKDPSIFSYMSDVRIGRNSLIVYGHSKSQNNKKKQRYQPGHAVKLMKLSHHAHMYRPFPTIPHYIGWKAGQGPGNKAHYTCYDVCIVP